MKYAFTFTNGRTFTPDGEASIPDVAEHNRQIEAAELARWQERPDRMLAYYHVPDVRRDERNRIVSWSNKDAIATTWLGTPLGRIKHVRIFRHNFGGRFISLRVQGTNGATYHGRASYDWGQCVMLRRCK